MENATTNNFKLICANRRVKVFNEDNCLHIYNALTNERLATYSNELLQVMDIDDMVNWVIDL